LSTEQEQATVTGVVLVQCTRGGLVPDTTVTVAERALTTAHDRAVRGTASAGALLPHRAPVGCDLVGRATDLDPEVPPAVLDDLPGTVRPEPPLPPVGQVDQARLRRETP
jgi:hypothetical protein